jgi:hypothetical protein
MPTASVETGGNNGVQGTFTGGIDACRPRNYVGGVTYFGNGGRPEAGCERIGRSSSDETNWAVKGVKFGKSEREQCNSALSVIIERLKQEFEIVD